MNVTKKDSPASVCLVKAEKSDFKEYRKFMHGLELRSGICIFTLWPMSEVSLSVVVSSCRARTVIVT